MEFSDFKALSEDKHFISTVALHLFQILAQLSCIHVSKTWITALNRNIL